MLRWLCNIKPEDRVPWHYIHERLRIYNLEKALRIRCMTWYRHAQRSDSWISKITDFEVAGKKRKGRRSKTWEDCVMKDLDVTGLKKVDTQGRNHWRAALWDYTSLHPPEGGNRH